MKKIKGVLLSLLLCCCLIVPIFAFTGCGGADPETVSNSLNELADVFKNNSSVFVEGYVDPDTTETRTSEEIPQETPAEGEQPAKKFKTKVQLKIVDKTGIKTKYKINYGENLNKAINNEIERFHYEYPAGYEHGDEDSKVYGYEELDRKYNVIFAYANEFIDTYKVHLPKKEDKLSDETNKALDDLNNSVKEYIESIGEFINQKNVTQNYYNTTNFSITTGLRAFERSYGAMIEKAVNVSSALAEVLEQNNMINYIKDYTASSNTTMIVEGFVRAQLLPVYSNFMLSEIRNKIWWETTNNEDKVTKDRITTLISKLETSFNSFKDNVKKASQGENAFNAIELKPLIENLVYVFVEDAEQYKTALTELNIQKLSVDYKNNMEKYAKEENAFAKTYLNKIEDFMNLVLDNFQNGFYGKVLTK